MLAVLQDMPSGGEPSPSPKDMQQSPTPAPTGDIDHDSIITQLPAVSASSPIHHHR